MTGQTNIPRSFIARLFIGLFIAAVLLPALQLAANALSPQQLEQLRQQERARIENVKKWAAKDPKATPRKIFDALYRPVAQANYRQMSQNLRLANGWYARGVEAEKNRKEKQAKTYYTIAALFKAYAQTNKAIVDAFKKGDSSALKQNCTRVKQIEKKLLGFRGVRIVRTWLTPDEWFVRASAQQAQ